jgi:hypothetical protein
METSMIGMPATPGNENIAQRRTRGFNEIRLFSEEPSRLQLPISVE